jgi:hypothetical protein
MNGGEIDHTAQRYFNFEALIVVDIHAIVRFSPLRGTAGGN